MYLHIVIMPKPLSRQAMNIIVSLVKYFNQEYDRGESFSFYLNVYFDR